MQCREFARQLVAASSEFQAHHAVSLIVGPGNRTQAERLVETLKADPAHVLYDERRTVYETYSLEQVFLSLIQQSAVFIIDGQGVVRFALVANNPLSWLNPQRIKQVNDLLDELNLGGT